MYFGLYSWLLDSFGGFLITNIFGLTAIPLTVAGIKRPRIRLFFRRFSIITTTAHIFKYREHRSNALHQGCLYCMQSLIEKKTKPYDVSAFILRLLFLFLTSLAWRCENLFAHQSSPSHHILLITAPSLRWSLAMGMINTKTIIYFSSLRQI
jgi:hypothetical protein